jgi:hypothetical protein
MSISGSLSRRSVLRRAGAVLSAVAALGPTARIRAQQQVTKAVARYQTHPNGQQRCEICVQFRQPHRCKLVEGAINPQGWCQFFAARENAR